MAEEWGRHVRHWLSLNEGYVSRVHHMPAPTVNDRYHLYQTLIGTWPDPTPSTAAELAGYRERIMGYMNKAIKEAKEHTSWVNPNDEYDTAVGR